MSKLLFYSSHYMILYYIIWWYITSIESTQCNDDCVLCTLIEWLGRSLCIHSLYPKRPGDLKEAFNTASLHPVIVNCLSVDTANFSVVVVVAAISVKVKVQRDWLHSEPYTEFNHSDRTSSRNRTHQADRTPSRNRTHQADRTSSRNRTHQADRTPSRNRTHQATQRNTLKVVKTGHLFISYVALISQFLHNSSWSVEMAIVGWREWILWGSVVVLPAL